MTSSPPQTGPERSRLRAAAVAVLVFDGFLCAVLSALFLPAYLGGTPFPIAIVAAGVVNVLLVMGVRAVTPRVRTAFAPLAAWLVGFVLCMAGGPGGDVILLATPWTLLLFVVGLVPALAYLWLSSMRAVVAAGHQPAAVSRHG
ncbi:hypothetical protein [Rhodococcus sp. HNM0569]|uniref:hypothetical protein n=1 Tax=Rhodococcus sp. HNM0569 TaxID=2716340 RepID=UPI00146B6964|nr:hypothetical protein [Rhodococcus sp. HNM0569]NLU83840.1 hypothetical protein [Rhodococcus sp. HNM0569]